MPSSPVSVCKCENDNQAARIKCLVDSFVFLERQRDKAPSNAAIKKMLDVQRLSDVRLANDAVGSVTSELAEAQILQTFFNDYIKKHPKFSTDGPSLDDIQSKTEFFQTST